MNVALSEAIDRFLTLRPSVPSPPDDELLGRGGDPSGRAGAKPCKRMHAARLAGSRPADTRRTSQIDDAPQITFISG